MSSAKGNGNFVVGPDYTIDPDLTDKGNPKGKSFEFTMRLADSKIFPGDDATLDPKKDVRKERKIFVYVPAAYQDGTKAPILVTHDGPSRMDLVRNALDNLTISKDPNRKLPAFIVIAVENGGNDGKGSERGLEYDTMSDRLARFINDEVLPAVLNNAEIKAAYPNIAFTDDPWGRAVMGCSSGGAAALTMGWFRPDLFRRLITYSGTFVDQQDDDAPEEAEYPLGAWEYHSGMKLIENSEKEAAANFHSRRRKRSAQSGSRRDLSQLGDGQRANRRGAQSQGLRLSVRFQSSHASTAIARSLKRRLPTRWFGRGAATKPSRRGSCKTAQANPTEHVEGMDPPHPDRPIVFRSQQRKACMESRLVLESVGNPAETIHHGGTWLLVVRHEDLDAAIAELEAYRDDKAGDSVPAQTPVAVFGGAIAGVAAVRGRHHLGRRSVRRVRVRMAMVADRAKCVPVT